MSDGDLPLDEQYDCAEVLSKYQDVIKAAYMGQLGPTGLPKDNRIEAVANLAGVLTADRSLCADLRRIIDAVLDGRELETITNRDFLKIASRSAEWLPTQRLSTQWVSAARA
jgi:hypothetical protein